MYIYMCASGGIIVHLRDFYFLTERCFQQLHSATPGVTIIRIYEPINQNQSYMKNYFTQKIGLTAIMPAIALSFCAMHAEASVKVTMNNTSTTMTLSRYGSGEQVETGTPANKVYTFDIEPGKYVLTGYASDGTTANGSLVLDIADGDDLKIFTPSVKASNKDADNNSWVIGEDYTINLSVTDKQMSAREFSPGWTSKHDAVTALVVNGDTFTVDIQPNEAHKAEGYLGAYQSDPITFNKNYSLALPMGHTFALTAPKDATVSVGTKVRHFIPFKEIVPVSETAEGENIIHRYTIGEKQVFSYRVSQPGKLTVAAKSTMPSGDLELTVSQDLMDSHSPKEIDRDPASNNGYNVADLFLNADHRGIIALGAGEKKQIVSLRAWEIVDGITSNYFIEPDYHFTVVGIDGKPSDSVVEVTADGMLTAKNRGTAFVLVSYDAIYSDSQLGGPFFGAIWPENTGVIVVRVDEPESGIAANMLLNDGLNPTDADRQAGPMIDAELDILYFDGDHAEYTFKPEGATSVAVASPTIAADAASYSGFSSDAVTANADGSYTIRLTEGRTIVKLSSAAGDEYQVVRAKKCTYTLSNLTSEGAEPRPGDKVSIEISTLYHPAHKLAGVYNMGATVQYTDPSCKNVSGKANQHQFSSMANARTLTITIPAEWNPEKDYKLTDGLIKCSGYGDPYGGHRDITYTVGKNPNFTAVQHTAYFGALPDITLYKGIIEEEPDENVAVLTFEDADFKGNVESMVYKTSGMSADNYWTSLIDSRQYNGPLLYPQDFDEEVDVVYQWFDQNNTDLRGGIRNGYGDGAYWGGGAAVSNYVADNYTGAGFSRQLEAYNPDGGNGGYAGSMNFLCLYGYSDDSTYSTDGRNILSFDSADGEPLYAYVNLNTYGLNVAFTGNELSEPISATDYVDVLAEALDADGNPTGASTTFRLIDGKDKVTDTWTYWDLTPLGKCRKIRFNMLSSLENDYGMSFPAYFLLDNFAVKRQNATDDLENIIASPDSTHEDVIYTLMGRRIERISAPGIYIVNGKKVLIK